MFEFTNLQSYIRLITQQPQATNNIFAIIPNEQILKTYVYEEDDCGCGRKFSVTLTDSRLIQRAENCALCGTGARSDKMLFLSDISTITDSVANKGCCSLDCGGSIGKNIGFIGPFGTQIFTFNERDVSDALFHIPAAAMPHKTSK